MRLAWGANSGTNVQKAKKPEILRLLSISGIANDKGLYPTLDPAFTEKTNIAKTANSSATLVQSRMEVATMELVGIYDPPRTI